MSIIRVHRKERDFFTVKREVLENTNLSFKAKGLWAYAMSRKDDWNFHVAHLVQVSKEKHTAIYSAIKELIDAGYCLKEKKKKADGTWEAVDYVVFETLEDAEEFKKSLPLSGFPQVENPRVENPPLVKNDNSEEGSTVKKRENARAKETASPENKEVERAPHVFTTEEEHAKLLHQFNEDRLIRLYNRLSLWKQDTPRHKWKKNDYRSILRWVAKAEEESKTGNDSWKNKNMLNTSQDCKRTFSVSDMRDPNSQTFVSLQKTLDELGIG